MPINKFEATIDRKRKLVAADFLSEHRRTVRDAQQNEQLDDKQKPHCVQHSHQTGARLGALTTFSVRLSTKPYGAANSSCARTGAPRQLVKISDPSAPKARTRSFP